MPPKSPSDETDLPSGGPKPRTADCARCVILRGLQQAGLPASQMHHLCERFWLMRARRHQLLYLEGNRATHVYALRSGRVKLSKHTAAGREHIVSVLGSGALFGLAAVFGGSYEASAEALGDAVLCMGARDDMEALVGEVPSFGLTLAAHLATQLDDARIRQAGLGTVGTRARLATLLLHEATRDGEERTSLPRDLTLADYGAMLGAAPETVCRSLGELRDRGVLEVDSDELRIVDIHRLRRIART